MIGWGHKNPIRKVHVAVMCGSYHNPFFTCCPVRENPRRVVITAFTFSVRERRHRRRRDIGACGSREGRESGEIVGPVRKIKALKA